MIFDEWVRSLDDADELDKLTISGAWKAAKADSQHEINQLRGALGYPVPGGTIEDPNIHNGIAEAMNNEIEMLKKHIDELHKSRMALRQALIDIAHNGHKMDIVTVMMLAEDAILEDEY